MPDDDPMAGTPEAEEGALNTITFTEVDGRTTLTTARGVPHAGGAGRDHRLRHGRRDAGGDGQARAGRDLARLSGRGQRAACQLLPPSLSWVCGVEQSGSSLGS